MAVTDAKIYYQILFAFLGQTFYTGQCRAKRGGSGALYSQSARAGLNSFSRLDRFKV